MSRAGTRLLDIGCGSGYAAQMAADLGGRYYRDRHHARAAGDRARAGAGCPFPRGGMDDASFPDGGLRRCRRLQRIPVRRRPRGRSARHGASCGQAAWSPRRRSPRPSATSPPRSIWRSSPFERAASAAPAVWAVGARGARAAADCRRVWSRSKAARLRWPGSTPARRMRSGPCLRRAAGRWRSRPPASRPPCGAGEAVVPFTLGDGSVRMNNVFRFAIARKPL